MTDKQKLIETVEAFLAELKSKQEQSEWPQVGEVYWFIKGDGEYGTTRNDGGDVDKNIIAQGNAYYYRTPEERDAAVAKVGIERIKQLAEYGVL